MAHPSSNRSERSIPDGARSPATHGVASFATRTFDLSNVQGLSKEALDLHLSLYEGYVKEANSLLQWMHAPPREAPSIAERLQADGLARRFAFERNGMVLHELFFGALRGKNGPPAANGAFVAAASRSFGAFEIWRNHAMHLGQTRGVGWVLTVQSPDGVFRNIWQDDHTRGMPVDSKIVLALDLWEHAFLLDFKPSQRSEYLTTVLDNVDWRVVESRCTPAPTNASFRAQAG